MTYKDIYTPGKKVDLPTTSFATITYKENSLPEELVATLINDKDDAPGKNKEITINDIFSFIISQEQAEKIIENKLHKEKHEESYLSEKTHKLTKEGINYFNKILHESVDFYQRIFHEKLHISYINKRDKDKNGRPICKTHKDVVDFLLHNTNKNDPTDKAHHCFLLKIMRNFNNFYVHQKEYEKAEETFEKIKREIILPHLRTKQEKIAEQEENIDYMRLRTRTSVSNKEPIYFTMSTRLKEKDRIILKMLSNSKYTSSEAIQDIYGMRNEVRTKEKALLLLEYYWKLFPGDIDHKNLFGKNLEEIEECIQEVDKKYNLDEDFKKILLEKITKEQQKTGKKNHENYEDVKIRAKMRDNNKKEHTVEIQINIVGNRNENGLAHHGVYEVKATIEAEVRGKGFTHEEKIKQYINDIIRDNIEENGNENPDLLYLGGLDRKQKYRSCNKQDQDFFKRKTHEYIFDHITKDFLNGYELKYPEKGRTKIYSTKTQREKFHGERKDEDLYPQNISRRE